MRIVFTVRAASGHFHPLVPLAHAAHDAGHEAAFATPAPFQSTVERLGFRWLKSGLDESSQEYARFVAERRRLSGRESTRFHRRGLVSVLAPPVVADLLRVAETWRPELIVWDYADFGGCVAAEVLGIPHASHEAGATFDDLMSDPVAPLADLRATYGLPPDPDQRMLERYLVLSPLPTVVAGRASCRTANSPLLSSYAVRSVRRRSRTRVAPSDPGRTPGVCLPRHRVQHADCTARDLH